MIDLLERAITANDSLLCVGLDPDPERIPEHLREERHPLFAFNREIIDATAAEVCAFKPQVAYYAAAAVCRLRADRIWSEAGI